MSADETASFTGLKVDKVEEGSIWILTIDNPPLNIITSKFFGVFEERFRLFSSDSASKVMILTGAGERAFSAGANVDEIQGIKNGKDGLILARRGQELCDRIEASARPVIAAVNGLCLGGGNEMAMACHIRIASERAKFAQPEINLGIIPGWGGTQRLSRLIGPGRARKFILTGDMISAKEAYNLGLVDEVVEHGAALDQALRLAGKIIRNSKPAVELAQQAIYAGLSRRKEEGMRAELDCFGKVCDTEDMQEAVKAHKEKRKPHFKGR